MLNFRKRIFLFLTIITTVLCLVSCTNPENTVRIKFDSDEYTVRMQTYLEVKPVIKASSDMQLSDIEVVYESSNEDVVRYEHGILYPVSEGEAQIKVYWKTKDVVFDKATVKVIKPALPELRFDGPFVILKNDVQQLPYSLYLNYTEAQISFTALNPDVATISEDGKVTAHKVGDAIIEAVISDYEETSEVYQLAVKVVESDFTITYDLNGGTNDDTNPHAYNTLDCPIPLKEATKNGYIFKGWKLADKVVTEIPALQTGNITLVALWEAIDYQLTFDLNGGTVDTTLPETYNGDVLPLTLPIAQKAGYEFKGWKLGEEVVTTLPEGLVGDVALTAVFEVVNYKLSFELSGGTVEGELPTTYNVEQLPFALPVAQKAGYEFKGWKLGEETITSIDELSGDVTLTAVFEIVTYKLTFDALGGTYEGVLPESYTVEQLPIALPDVTKLGYTYNGWKVGKEVVKEIKVGTTGDLTITAELVAINYEVKMDLNGGTVVGAYATREEMVNDFMKDFGAFAGITMTTPAEYWKQTNEKTSFWKDAEMHAKWSWIFEALIPFAKAQGIDTKYLNNMLANPVSVSGYATQNVAIYLLGINNAMWNETYSSTYGNLSSKWTTVNCTSDAVKASWMAYVGIKTTHTIEEDFVLPTLTKPGYKFVGWMKGEEMVTVISKDTLEEVSVTAVFEAEPYSIVFDLNGGSYLNRYNSREEMVNDFMKDFNEFGKTSFTSPAEYWNANAKTSFWKDATMHAKWSWIFEALITFAKTQGIDTKYLSNMLADPISVSGYATQNVAIYLLGINSTMWNETYSATYGKLSSKWTTVDCTSDAVKASWMTYRGIPTTYTIEDEVNLPTLVKENYKFVGWMLGDKVVTKIEKGTYGELTLVAVFEGVTYEIDYVLGEGETLPEGAQKSYQFGKGLATLPTPVKEGYDFLGWYEGDALVTSISDTRTGKVTLTAKWEKKAETKEYNIIYNLDGGTLPEDAVTKFVGGVGLETLPTPTREGYKFLGWFIGEELVTSISKDAAADVTLDAHWEKIPETQEFNITYDLDGGSWPVTKIETYEEMAQAFMNAYVEYIRGYAEKPYTGGELTPADFMDVSYNYGQLENFFSDTRYAEWVWVKTFIIKYCESVSYDRLAILQNESDKYHNTVLRGNVHGFLNNGLWEKWPASANYKSVKFEDFKDSVPAGKTIEGPTKYTNDVDTTLVTPVKENFDFAGWMLNDQIITFIPKGTTGDLTLKARWRAQSGEQGVILVGENQTYKTIDEAMAVAMPGDVIKLEAGTYTGGTITVNGVSVVGPNKGINPINATRVAEAVFTGDLVVAASNVTIDGIKLTGKGRLVGSANGLSDLTVANVHIHECNVNDANVSNNAPLYFYTTVAGASFRNLVFTNVYNSETKEARAMILFGNEIDGLTMTDCKFVGNSKNYNDGIKLDNNGQFGLKGKVELVGNHFEGYSQYVVWFRGYSAGQFNIENNTFVNCGQTATAHAALTMVKFMGTATDKVTINFRYNTVDNSYMAFRLDKQTVLSSDNFEVHVNYNKIKNCKATSYVKNSCTFMIDATNNWYDVAPVAGMFINASWEPFYDDETKVPLYGQPLTFKSINYELNGGTLPEGAPTSFDSTTGLQNLPVPTHEKLVFVGWKLNGEYVTSIPAGTDTAVTLVAEWREDAIYVSKNGEPYAVQTIEEALKLAKEGSKIIILAGEYAEDVTITTANLTIAGANQGINPNTLERASEAIIKGVITISKDAVNLTIDGLAFTGNAKIKNQNNGDTISGLTFMNCVVYDTQATTDYVVNRYQMNAFLEIKVSSGASKNIQVFNNKFTKVGDINVLVNRVENLTVDGNVFEDFGRDAIRVEGGYCYGIVSFTNNHFEQTTAGSGYAAIFTYSIAGSGGTQTKVIVKGNEFVKVGTNDTKVAPFNGTVVSNVFQENPTEWMIEDNVFDHCSNMMWIRNNGAKESTWKCTVQNNQFLGTPLSYYFGTYNGNDTETTNPHLAIFGANYYEDNEGNVITDLSGYADMFKHLKTYGTTLAEKAALADGEKFEFWKISYDLAGGSAKGLVNYYHRETGTITLPTPTWNIYHEFKGWTLNGEVVTEIPAGTKGDLHLVATWEELEGNPATLEFELNGGNWNYASFDEISLDLLKDYNAFGGTTYSQANVPTGAWENINIHTFFYSEGMAEKWGWLASWLGEVGGSANKAGCTALVNNNDASSFDKVNGNYKCAVSYEFRAIMIGGAVTSNGNYKTSDYSNTILREKVWDAYAKVVKTTIETTEGKEFTLPTPKKPFLTFVGWYDNPEFTGDAITTITVAATNPKLYAKFEDLNPVTNVNILNPITTTKRFTELQLEWEVLPATTANKGVKFITSDEKVAKISSTGLVEFLTAGTVTIKVVSLAKETVYGEMTVDVYVPEHIDGAFVTNSYVIMGQTIELEAVLRNGEGTIEWKSNNPDIATVENGVVTPVKAGTAVIVASKVGDPTVKVEFIIIVYDEMPTDVLEFVLRQNNSNIFLRSELGIGAGGYAYYADILSSVSKLLFSKYEVDMTYYKETPTRDNYGSKDLGIKERPGALEFITVHYTGNMARTSYASSNANYFVNQSNDSSIHYVTGNEGVYYCYDEKWITWHAGDGTSTLFEWHPTGVVAKEGDPEYPVVTITENSKFAINGTETTVSCPTGHPRVYNPETKKMQDDESVTIVPTDNKYLTDLGPAVIVKDGQYYIGSTWWCNNQVAEGRVCSRGGNLNSIGIETACNEGSDLWLTWQKTAQLVADLMIRYDLDIQRVKGHNFFSAKNCPQPMLENEDEIWWEFIDLCKAEHEAMSTYKDYTFEMKSSNPEIVNDLGRVIKQPEYDTCVTYTVTITKGEETKTITMSSMIPGYYRNLARGER